MPSPRRPPRIDPRPVAPPLLPFTKAERALIARLNTPSKVQRWLNAVRYNTERNGGTQRSFRPVARTRMAHCMEGALFAAVVLEQHGYPPLVMSLESQDWLDHVIFIYREKTGWGSVARSRDPGLHGRKPLFRSPRALARSYCDAYVDYTGRVKGYGVANLAEALPHYDWRLTTRNAWRVEQLLIDWPHRKIKTSTARYRRLLQRYKDYRATHDDRKPVYYKGRDKWEPIPAEFLYSKPMRRSATRGK